MDTNCVPGHDLRTWASNTFHTLLPLVYYVALLRTVPLQRNERFSQGGPRGMGPGNLGYGRVREEFDGPSKKPRF